MFGRKLIYRTLRLLATPTGSTRTGYCRFITMSSAKPYPLVGVVQMTSTPKKQENIQTASKLIEKATSQGAQMVFLPEAFDIIGSNRNETLAAGEPLDGPTIKHFQNLAKLHNIWLSLGGFHEKSSDPEESRLYNTHVILDNNGSIQGTYHKAHLFDVDIEGSARLQESKYTIPGEEIVKPVQTPVGNVGMAICYDMRFPEHSLALRNEGAEILTYPSAFTVPTGKAHWETILRCRAVETQCYVIAAAQVGQHTQKRASYGHSMVVDPWGKILAECPEGVDVCIAEIDLDFLRKRRTEMPVTSHRRHDLYGNITTNAIAPISSEAVYQFGQFTVPASCVFYRTALSYAFVNKKPVLPGHVLISPIRCAEKLADLTSAEVADLFTTAQKVLCKIEQHYSTESMTMAVQDGPDAGQTVAHVHVHILPRKPGDFSKNDDVYDKLEKHDEEDAASKWRTEEEMSQEAAIFRTLFS